MRTLLALLIALIAGCGNKGPLYLPQTEPAAPETVPIPPSAPERPVPAEAVPRPK